MHILRALPNLLSQKAWDCGAQAVFQYALTVAPSYADTRGRPVDQITPLAMSSQSNLDPCQCCTFYGFDRWMMTCIHHDGIIWEESLPSNPLCSIYSSLHLCWLKPLVRASQVVQLVNNPPANARDARDVCSIPGSGRAPGGGNVNPCQYSCLESSMVRGAWRATVHGVTQSWTRLSDSAYTHTEATSRWQFITTDTFSLPQTSIWKSIR